MAYGLDTARFNLKEWVIKIGVWTNPELIGTDAIDPTSRFTGDIIGWPKQGSENLMLTRAYAEALGKTPGQLLRKDLIRKQMTFEFQMFQDNVDLDALLTGALTQPAYPVTSPAAASYDIAWIGPDEPTQSTYGYLMERQLTDGTLAYVAIWSGKITTEEVGLQMPGTDYAVRNAKIEAFVHSSFTGATADQKSYGANFRKVA